MFSAATELSRQILYFIESTLAKLSQAADSGSSTIGQLFTQPTQRLKKRRHVVANNAPECVVVDAQISADQAVSRGIDSPPRTLTLKFVLGGRRGTSFEQLDVRQILRAPCLALVDQQRIAIKKRHVNIAHGADFATRPSVRE